MSKRFGLLILIGVLLAAAVPSLAQEDAPLIGLGTSETLGSYLVGPNGMTLYAFDRDSIGTSVCVEQCAANWPALTVESADELTAADGIPGTLGTAERADGALQVTYNGVPLYYWKNDAAAGDTTGNRVGNVWWVVPPATVYWQAIPELGRVLVGPTGMTVYMFKNDVPDSGVSVCTEGCAAAWPPVLVDEEGAVTEGVNLPGEVGTITREDGTFQVTYNGWPLYYWQNDAAVGDATGEGMGDVWYTLSPETAAVSANETLGDILVSTTGMTLYLFANDEAGSGASACSGGCAEAWPPYTVAEGVELTPGTGLEGELATITREDGTLQVTYNGWPLYFWQNDLVPGDATGDGVGGVWAAAKP